MIGQHSYTVRNAAACIGFEAEFVAVGTVGFLSDVLHWQGVLGSDGIVGGFAVDEFDAEVFGAQLIGMYPGMDLESFAEAELTLTATFYVEIYAVPVLADFILPCCQRSR